MANGISRRQFLKGAAASAVGIAALGALSGCSQETENKENESTEKYVLLVL